MRRKNSKKGCFFVFAMVSLILTKDYPVLAGEIENSAPPAVYTAENGIPEIIPFRVWVVPSSGRGVVRAGHYEFFELSDPVGYRGIALQSPSLEAVYPAIPLPTGGEPAIPGN